VKASRVGIVALLALSLGASLFVALDDTLVGDPASGTAPGANILAGEDVRALALGCVPIPLGSGTPSAIADCVKVTFVAAGDDFGVAGEVFTSAAKRDPFFADACHLGAHEAGRALALRMDPADALSVSSSVCSSGLVHGIFDALGETSPDFATWDELASVCEDLRRREPAACADGMGHAAWDVTGDVAYAEELCLTFTEYSARSECAEGVQMQRYAPATERAGRPRDERPLEVAEICRIESEPSILEGCRHGIGWLLANDIAALADSHDALRGAVPVEARSPLAAQFATAAAACSTLFDGEAACSHRLLTAVPVALYLDRPTRDALCSSAPMISVRCREIATAYTGS